MSSGFSYATLVSHDDELLPVFLLAHSLQQYGSQFPLVVLTQSSTISEITRRALELESKFLNFCVESVEGMSASAQNIGGSHLPAIVNKQTKLGVFSSPLWKYDMVCYLSPNSLVIRHGMDLVFSDALLPTSDWLAAAYLCTCEGNRHVQLSSLPDDDSTPGCPYLRISLRGARSRSIAVVAITNDNATQSFFDPGMFVFYPGERLWDRIYEWQQQGHGGTQMPLSDAEVLAYVFRDRWMPLRWSYFATEPLQECHSEFGEHDSVICIQYGTKWSPNTVKVSGVLERPLRSSEVLAAMYSGWQSMRSGSEDGNTLLGIIESQYSSSERGLDLRLSEKPSSNAANAVTLHALNVTEGKRAQVRRSEEAPFES
jgi:hypothetical protein